MALLDNITEYWKLDEASGNRTGSVASTVLTDNNTVAAGAGIINNGADFEAANSEWLSNATGLTTTGDTSVSGWFKFESLPTGFGVFGLVTNINNDQTKGWKVFLDNEDGTNNFLKVQFFNTATAISAAKSGANPLPSTATWYHVVVTMDVSAGSAGIVAYVNGSEIAMTDGTSNATSIDAPQPFSIGALKSSGESLFDGIIDEVGVWTRVLTSAEVTSLYNAGAGFAYPFAGPNTAFLSFMGPQPQQ